mmetsp:Transcript_16365/g.28727  ORF Transcript_16365/g.28727 Transcript_16365/m.28727 type:complete len:551 (+) Transcript_16365:69-1721(+)|eukprot:CAMPEP_0197657550 /NCGR_PEP_ID=MMETSP1338-20131121/44695_1 /TAXON_ID=43686 ORGANISM="Pelagodinium beii, Strain RCC1491" /NCGR_SAMPLE_ID=MMETSP1338 /ASSEMBLY_ACC=CAM_ASM_000754 /LENGTH=550 /DNA_ID=CAMNT_0043233945 /DNA_START=46 /DNA_END=1698 /DNA_ORIENTATION=-
MFAAAAVRSVLTGIFSAAGGVLVGLRFGRRQDSLPAPQAGQSSAVETQKIDGKAVAESVRLEIKDMTAELEKSHGIKPGLAVILVGERKDSQSYVRNKKKAAAEVNFHTVDVALPDTVSQDELLAEVEKLNLDPKVHAILVQLPLPKHIDEALILKTIRVDKDADGFSAMNIGNLCLKGGDPPLAVPCTPAGCIELLQRAGVEVAGKNAVVLGRSNIVGMPVSQLLQSMDATVTVCHSRTKDMVSYVRNADIVVAAIGKAEFVRGDWLKPGCVVIDVGINSVDDATKKLGYRLVGDVNYKEAQGIASHITPVPGGVGPMTIAMLLKNTLNLARHSAGLPRVPLRRTSKADAAPKANAGGTGIPLPANEDIAVVMACKDSQSLWDAAVAAGALRDKVKDITKSHAPPSVVLHMAANGTAPVSLISLSSEKVICSAADVTQAAAAIGGSAAAPASQASRSSMTLPKGEEIAIIMSCKTGADVWKAAVQAHELREKIQEASCLTSPPAVVFEGPESSAAAVSLVSFPKDSPSGKVLCTAGAVSEAVTAIAGTA